jgi:ATP-binding cassette subfamily B protein
MPLDYFSSERNAEVQARMVNDLGGVSDVITSTANNILRAVATLLACMAVMVLLNWKIAVASMLVMIGLAALNRRFSAQRRSLAQVRQEHLADVLKSIAEDLSFSGILLGRTLRQSRQQRRIFADQSRTVASTTYRLILVGRTTTALSWATLGAIPPVIYWVSGAMLPRMSLGSVVVLVMLQTRIAGPIHQLAGLNSTLQSSGVMLQRVFEYLDLPAETSSDEGLPGQPPSDTPSISMTGVGYRYSGRERPALHPFNLDLKPGSVTFLMGETGSGKSTLALLLTGLLAPSSGTVEVDGAPVSASGLRQLATLVPQESVLFNRSLRDNLCFAKPDAEDAELYSALQVACLDSLLEKLPAGLESPVGERGYQLSGGERQRLSLARAVLSGTRVLVLDEATSALDAATASLVMARLRAEYADRTLAVVTHREPEWDPGDLLIALAGGVVSTDAGAVRS